MIRKTGRSLCFPIFRIFFLPGRKEKKAQIPRGMVRTSRPCSGAERPGALFVSSTAADLRPVGFIEKLYSPGEPLLISQTGITEGLRANPRHFDRLLRYLGDARGVGVCLYGLQHGGSPTDRGVKAAETGSDDQRDTLLLSRFYRLSQYQGGGPGLPEPDSPACPPASPGPQYAIHWRTAPALLKQQKDPTRFIVKINRGVGGAGILRGGNPFPGRRALKDSLENGKKGKAAISFDSLRHEPFILEELVGELSENLSIHRRFLRGYRGSDHRNRPAGFGKFLLLQRHPIRSGTIVGIPHFLKSGKRAV